MRAFLLSGWAYVPLVVLWIGYAVHAVAEWREDRRERVLVLAHVEKVLSQGGEVREEDAETARQGYERTQQQMRTARRWSYVAFVAFGYAAFLAGVGIGAG